MSNKIEIVSASAGSGKTYHLSRELEQQVRSGSARPTAILGTTFTNKAAAELERRVRTRLIAAGLTDAAHQLAGARLGTVNSVCGRLVSDFALELGLSPKLQVLDEPLARMSLKRAVELAITDGQRETLKDLSVRMWDLEADAAIHHVINTARSNRVGSAQLLNDIPRSRDRMLAALPPPKDASTLEARFKKEALAFLKVLVDAKSDAVGTNKALEAVRKAVNGLERGQSKWHNWLQLSNLKPGAEFKPLAAALEAAAFEVGSHPKLHEDLARTVETVLGVAATALQTYEEQKRAWGAIDFVDQEVYALQLLEENAEAQARMREELDLVIVDEFQDTSPLQLQLFVKLAGLAKRTVWVGDQKQSIFGFRGTDPALMDVAIQSLLKKEKPLTLGHSHRSRPALVRLTSALFAPPFEAQGIPEERVVLEPFLKSEPKELGPVVEQWLLKSEGRAQPVNSLADAVRKLLNDPTTKVRDATTKQARAVRPGDVAVLCRRREICIQVADALAALGIKAAVARKGLLVCHEAQLALAALQLFIDKRDALAAATLGRALLHADAPDTWLDEVLAPRDGVPFEEAGFHLAMASARDLLPSAGAVAALDAACEAVGLRELCLRWGDSPARLANLDALRALAVQYEARAGVEGLGSTPAGLVAALAEFAEEGEDAQAVVEGDDAVVVSTWHSAKGLEWPIVVLFELEYLRDEQVFGVRVESDAKAFDFQEPLEGRWVRYWPNPFHPNTLEGPLLTALRNGPEAQRVNALAEAQELRLLYVGWTRAKDRVVLTTQKVVKSLARLKHNGKSLLAEPDEQGRTVWAGQKLVVGLRDGEQQPEEERTAEPEDGPMLRPPAHHPDAWVSPSKLQGRAVRTTAEQLAPRVALAGKPDMNDLGMAVHGFLGADRDGLSAPAREVLAASCLGGWGVAGALQPLTVVAMGDALKAWAGRKFPGARWQRELPVMMRGGDGAVVRGSADLVLKTATGFALVDHKTFPGGLEEAKKRADEYAGQLDAYVAALEAAGLGRCEGVFVHLPVSGYLLQLDA